MDSFFILYYTGSHLKNLFILLFYRNAGFRQHSGNFPGKEVVLWRLCPGFTGIAEKRKLIRTLSLLSRLIQERGGFCWQPSVMGSGEVASGFLMERLQQHFYEEILPLIRKGKSSKKIRHSFFRCLYETVGMLQKYADSREISLGATLSVLLLMKRRYLILHVGDSRIYEIRKKRIRQLTEDHRGEGNILTRCMGSFPMSEVYVRFGRYHKKTGFLLCSDGFWGRAAEELLREMLDPSEILTEEQIQKRFSEIGSYGKRQGERDNLSAIYVLLKREEEGFEGNSL